MKISQIKLSNFRIFKNATTIKLGENLTVISGINGVGKSTILAALVNGTADTKTPITPLVAQKQFSVPFESLVSYDEKGDRNGSDVVTINYKNVPDLEKSNNSSKNLNVSFRTHKTKVRNKEYYRFRLIPQKIPKVRESESKLTWPTLYLGLARLAPTGESDFVEVSEINSEISQHIVETQKHLMYDSIVYDVNSVQYIKGDNSERQHAGLDTDLFSVKSNSVGQDNLSQILLSIESFRLLQENPDYVYNGGLIAIDEIDAGLHPAVQISLVKYLLKQSKELDLQIVFTTHSITLLEEISDILQDNESVLINYIDRQPSTGDPEVIEAPAVSFFKNNLANKIDRTSKPIEPIHVLTEDRVAQSYLKKLISKSKNEDLTKLNLLDIDISWSQALKLSQSDPKAFKNWIFVLDPDVPRLINDQETNDGRPYSYIINNPTRSHILTLPGLNNFAIERMVWEFISNSQNDIFWDDIEIRNMGYRYETICNNYSPEFIAEKTSDEQPTEVFKNWHSANPELFEFFLNMFIDKNRDQIQIFYTNLTTLQKMIQKQQASE